MQYFTADLHLNQRNIVAALSKWKNKVHCRQFESLEAMNTAIIGSINDVVGADDTLRVLGDFAMGGRKMFWELRNRINCRNIHLIYGNHDKTIRESVDLQSMFLSCAERATVTITGEDGVGHETVLDHYCISGIWERAHKGWWHLFGHSHGNLSPSRIHGKCFDCGWDVWKRPLSEYDVARHMATRPDYQRVDHHGTDPNE